MYKQYGSSLIELLISLTLMSILLLVMDVSQVATLKKTKENYYFSLAQQQINNMSQRLNTKNKDLNKEIIFWNKQNKDLLPQGLGKVSGHYPHFRYEVYWGEENPQSCPSNKLGIQGCVYAQV